jgi:transcription initiation factor TFIIIB Brf1 subunit/transcription initiation factor TFIIB
MIDVTKIDPEARFEMMYEIITNAYALQDNECRRSWRMMSREQKTKMTNGQIFDFISIFLKEDPLSEVGYKRSKIAEYFAA